MDTGATITMSPISKDFITLKPIPKRARLVVVCADGTRCPVESEGVVQLHTIG